MLVILYSILAFLSIKDWSYLIYETVLYCKDIDYCSLSKLLLWFSFSGEFFNSEFSSKIEFPGNNFRYLCSNSLSLFFILYSIIETELLLNGLIFSIIYGEFLDLSSKSI